MRLIKYNKVQIIKQYMIGITATFVRILPEVGILVPKEVGVILIINCIY